MICYSCLYNCLLEMKMISGKIQLRDTKIMGKGYFAKEDIKQNEQLLIVSDQTFITCDRYLDFFQFSDLRNEQRVSNRALFAYFLASVSITSKDYIPEHNDIHEYFKTLPTQMHALICWSSQELAQLHNQQLINRVKHSKETLEKDYRVIRGKIEQVWQLPVTKHECRLFFKGQQIKKVTLELVIYFYAVIESRSVYYICQEDSESNAGAIAPHLELFNHSPNPQCQVCGNQRFTVRTTKQIPKGEEIFVSYGRNTEETFLEVYGFLESLQQPIPENENYRTRVASEYNKIYSRKKVQNENNQSKP